MLAGGNAGVQANTSSSCAADCKSSGLDVAVASTGRMSSGSLTQTGGGDVIIRVGGNLNPASDGLIQQLSGTVTDLRGAISIRTGAVGQAPSTYATNVSDPRTISPLAATGVNGGDGITVAPGDAEISIETRRDLVIGAVSDPTRLPQQYLSTLTTSTGSVTGLTWFSLWQPRTEADLFSLGGNVTPTAPSAGGSVRVLRQRGDGRRDICHPRSISADAEGHRCERQHRLCGDRKNSRGAGAGGERTA